MKFQTVAAPIIRNFAQKSSIPQLTSKVISQVVKAILNKIREIYKVKLRLTLPLLRKDQFRFIKKLTPVATPMARRLAETRSRPLPRRSPRNSSSSKRAVEPPTMMYLIKMNIPLQFLPAYATEFSFASA